MQWVGDRLLRTTSGVSGKAREQRYDVSYAWDALSQSRLQDDEFREAVGRTLLTVTAMRQSNLVIMRPEAATLLYAMADAVGVPFNPEQKTVDLLPNQRQKKLFKEAYPTIAKKIDL